jgi:hypothetical protein
MHMSLHRPHWNYQINIPTLLKEGESKVEKRNTPIPLVSFFKRVGEFFELTTLDMLLKQPSKTPDLYASQVAPLVEKAMNGFNSTVFA